MKLNEQITVDKIYAGRYIITMPDGTRLVGAAASTIIALTHAVFLEEASDTEIPHEPK